METGQQASEQIEAFTKAISEAQKKADMGDKMAVTRAAYLQGELAKLITPQPQPLTQTEATRPTKNSRPATRSNPIPQSLRIDALRKALDDATPSPLASPKPDSEGLAKARASEQEASQLVRQPNHQKAALDPVRQESAKQNFLEGDTQVTDVSYASRSTSEKVLHSVRQNAGVSPHAPDRHGRKEPHRPNARNAIFNLRMPKPIKAALSNKAGELGLSSSAYVLEIVAADLLIPIDDLKAAHNKELREAFAKLIGSWNKIGGLLNQLAAASNRGRPCPFSRPELDELRRQHRSMIVDTARKLNLD